MSVFLKLVCTLNIHSKTVSAFSEFDITILTFTERIIRYIAKKTLNIERNDDTEALPDTKPF